MKKKPDPRPGIVRSVKAAQPTPIVAVNDEDFWTSDPMRSEALRLLLSGMKKAAVARKVDRHRNTIDNWLQNPIFVTALNQAQREHISATRQERLMSTNIINGLNERMTIALGMQLEKTLKIDKSTGVPTGALDQRMLRDYREIASEFRETREQERIDIGDDVRKIDINSRSHQTITGDVHVTQHGVNDTPFVDFVRKALDSKIIDAKCIEVKDNPTEGQLLLKTAEHLLVDTDLLDQINEEDIVAEEARKNQ